MVELAIAGLSQKEIAARVGCAPATVSNTLRQPHSRQHMIKDMSDVGKSTFKDLLDGSATGALRVVKAIAEDEDNKASDRLAAANILINRRFGTPRQSVDLNVAQRPLEELSTAELKAIAGGEEPPA